MITDINQLDLSKTYTYADYLSWQLKERVELIRGKIFQMSPAPSRQHQEISFFLATEIGIYLKQNPCKAYTAPFDVRLFVGDKETVVQPDICVVCDTSKLDDRGCQGAPDLIIEILSPGNSRKERKEKFELYEAAGVREYWLVEPAEQSILVYTLQDSGRYIGSKPFVAGETIRSTVLPGMGIEVEQVFE